MPESLEKTLSVGTDVATWMLFHPDDLAHRLEDPSEWWTYDFAIRKEFEAGRLVAVGTGSDGSFNVRFTTGGLTEREQQYLAGSQEFRLRVGHGRIYFDNTDGLPSDERLDEPEDDPEGWIDLANGDYQVTVHAIAWHEEPGALDKDGRSTRGALTSYVVVFESVANLEQAKAPKVLPDLRCFRRAGKAVEEVVESDQTEEQESLDTPSSQSPLQEEYLLLVRNEAVFPRVEVKLLLTRAEYELIQEEFDRDVVVAPDATRGTIASFVHVSSTGSSQLGDEPEKFRLSGYCYGRARVDGVQERDGLPFVQLSLFEPPPATVSQEALDRLKTLFATFATNDPGYRERVNWPRFTAERIESLTDPQELGWRIAVVLGLAPEEQRELLALGDDELILRLNQLLEHR